MGGFFSRVGSDPYYMNYEKSFDKLETKLKKITVRRHQRKLRSATYTNFVLAVACAAAVLSALGVAWINQRPPGTYTLKKQVSLCGLLMAVPGCLFLLHQTLGCIYRLLDSRDASQIKKINDAKKKMIKDLKDSTRFEKTMALIKKFDPDAQAPTLVPPAQMTMPGATGGKARLNGATPSSNVLLKTGSAAAAVAGKALFPVFDKLANSVIGDNPALLEDLRRVQQEAESLKQENILLKARLAELEPDSELVKELGGTSAPPAAQQPGTAAKNGSGKEGAATGKS